MKYTSPFDLKRKKETKLKTWKLSKGPILISFFLIAVLLGCNYSKSEPTSSSLSPPAKTVTSVPNTNEQHTVVYKAPIDVSMLSDGETIRVNLVRFTGKIPSPNASVTVNSSPATIDDNGNYYILLDLSQGENLIEIKTTTNTETKTNYVHMIFEPPLIIRLDLPDFNFDNDYLKNPLTLINGSVSNPMAKVEVNGLVQEVRPDGTFTASILSVKGSNIAKATATLGNETDSYNLFWIISDQGHPGFVPGYSITYQTRIITQNPLINLKSGESSFFDFGIDGRKATPSASPALIEIVRVAKLGEGPQLPALPNLKISVEPSSYLVYPRIQYYSRVTIDTEPDLMPGDYYYYITFSDSVIATSRGLTVNIN